MIASLVLPPPIEPGNLLTACSELFKYLDPGPQSGRFIKSMWKRNHFGFDRPEGKYFEVLQQEEVKSRPEPGVPEAELKKHQQELAELQKRLADSEKKAGEFSERISEYEKKLDELANSVQSPAEVLNEFAEEDPESAPPQPQTETPQEDEIIYQPIQEKVLNDDGKPGELYQT